MNDIQSKADGHRSAEPNAHRHASFSHPVRAEPVALPSSKELRRQLGWFLTSRDRERDD